MTRSKAIGTAAETAVVRWLRDHGWPHAERRALTGTLDRGDVTGTPGICWEVKSGAQAEQPPDGQIAAWMGETETERRNAGADIGVLVLRRRGKGTPGDWWAYVPVSAFAWLWNLAWGTTPTDHETAPARMRLGDLVPLLRDAGYGRTPDQPVVRTTTPDGGDAA